ncbi:MAG: sigma-70 family RNA polymerase sigma factor [Bacteroidales bacterium]|nr:sigma-70 family RNA polymerase sigma factor [Bacteroidales bacterium]
MAVNLEILIRGCKRGDAGSQQKLYRQFSRAMYGICLQYASSEEDAQDILQDGFVKVFNKISQVKDPKAFPGWIRRVMINTALEKYRSLVHMERVDDEPGLLNEQVAEETLDRLNAETIVQMIQELSPRYRMVFSLYAIEGYSHKEIGEMLNISEGTSKSNLSRARVILQEKVKAVYGTMKRNG